jgi:hypothetical protein
MIESLFGSGNLKKKTTGFLFIRPKLLEEMMIEIFVLTIYYISYYFCRNFFKFIKLLIVYEFIMETRQAFFFFINYLKRKVLIIGL